MGICFSTARITAEVYEQVASGQRELPEDLDEISLSNWKDLFRYLNGGDTNGAELKQAAFAITGVEDVRGPGCYGNRVLSPRVVAAIAKDFAGSDLYNEESPTYAGPFDEEEIRHRYQFIEQDGGYGGPLDQIMLEFNALRELYLEAAAAGDGVAIWRW